MQLRDRLAALLGRVPWVQPVLAAPLAWVEFGSQQTAAWVLHQDNLYETLGKAAEATNEGRGGADREGVEMIEANASDIYQRPVPTPGACSTATVQPSGMAA
jgi:hypothetical protein